MEPRQRGQGSKDSVPGLTHALALGSHTRVERVTGIENVVGVSLLEVLVGEVRL